MKVDPASFRDDRGFVYWENNQIFRQINLSGQAPYDSLMKSGLYKELTESGLLIRHTEETNTPKAAYRIIKPEMIDFISYPYEWSFSQLRDAAVATLTIQKLALAKDLTLRDASAYNIQFVAGKPRIIDTLSFEEYHPGQPWQAYRQFCQHFLAPLALASHVDPELIQLMRVYIDGVPLALAAKLLPGRSLFIPGLYMHIKLHGRFQERYSDEANPGKLAATTPKAVSQTALLGVLDSLERTIKGLKIPGSKTQWSDYYNDTNYSPDAVAAKEDLVSKMIEHVKPKRVIDLGANNGAFSRLAKNAELVISADIDSLAVERNYQMMRQLKETKLMPLLIDLTNPSPGLGWNNEERGQFSDRAKSDLAMALALVHHLAIANNVPLAMIARYFADIAPNLIIEFVPKTDSQVQRLLATREDIFTDYTEAGFEAGFKRYFTIAKKSHIKDSKRTLYLMKRNHDKVS